MDVLIAAAVFTALVVALAAIVLIARRILVPAGQVPVVVNSDRTLVAETGDKLLSFLAENGIQLPAACGGRGSCGQCRVMIESGARPLTPAEENHIDQHDGERGLRLACMLTVREPLALMLPPDVLDARQWRAVVRSNENVTTFLTCPVLELDAPMSFEAGDYVVIEAPPYTLDFRDIDVEPAYEEGWARLGLRELSSVSEQAERRAYSIASPPAETELVTLTVRVAPPPANAPPGTPPGKVSSWLFGLKPGDEVALSGPFGEFHVRDTDKEMVFIGGGAGIAPLRSMILDQLERVGTARTITFWYGARNPDEVCFAEDFDRLAQTYDNFTWQVALSDVDVDPAWEGHRGFVHAVVRDVYLESHPSPEALEYYLCGPPVMAHAVIAMLEDFGVDRDSVFLDDFGG